jgi:hypothetical protein
MRVDWLPGASTALAVQVTDVFIRANTLHDFGNLYLHTGQYQQALSDLRRAAATYRTRNDKHATSVALGDSGWSTVS